MPSNTNPFQGGSMTNDRGFGCRIPAKRKSHSAIMGKPTKLKSPGRNAGTKLQEKELPILTFC